MPSSPQDFTASSFTWTRLQAPPDLSRALLHLPSSLFVVRQTCSDLILSTQLRRSPPISTDLYQSPPIFIPLRRSPRRAAGEAVETAWAGPSRAAASSQVCPEVRDASFSDEACSHVLAHTRTRNRLSHTRARAIAFSLSLCNTHARPRCDRTHARSYALLHSHAHAGPRAAPRAVVLTTPLLACPPSATFLTQFLFFVSSLRRRSNGRFSVADIRATVPMDGGLNGVAKDADDDKNK
eukprot:658996-Pleurochrysis_carterae.AAC.1